MVFTNFFDNAKKGNSSRAAPSRVIPSASVVKHDNRRRQTPEKHANAPTTKKNRPRKRSRPPKKIAHDYSSKRQNRSGPPSADALALSAALKELSSQKRLKEALDMYWDPCNDSIRDGHHGCIMVDCCARCGDMEQGEKVANAMQQSGTDVSVQTKTALLKGYAHSGMMHKGAALFKEMCLSKSKRDRPNVRTLNTLLRGCLWTAASVSWDNEDTMKVSGGVITSEEAWSSYRSSQGNSDGLVDSSSYEYSIVMLCQALLCDVACARIDEMKQLLGIQFHHEKGYTGGDHTALESLAVCLLALARSYALLGRVREAKTTAQSAVNVAEKAMTLLNSEDGKHESQAVATGKISGGGKRAWRSQGEKSSSQSNESDVSRRTVSNSLFRTHRLSEICSESTSILNVCKNDPPHFKRDDLAFFLLTRLLYFSGGGTTELSTTRACQTADGIVSAKNTRMQLINSLWISFGLKAALEHCKVNVPLPQNQKNLKEEDCKKICEAMGLKNSLAIDDGGFVQFDRVFASRSHKSNGNNKRPLSIELGAGFGDWIVMQAQHNPSTDYVAVELRSDRVAQTFSKALVNDGVAPLPNLCCVGSECGSFLRSRVAEGTVSAIYVNHPEPPTQTFGSQATDLVGIAGGAAEPAHMLNSETLLSSARCLDKDVVAGKLVIVTDNRWYARLICATLLKVMRSNDGLLRSTNLDGQRYGLRQIEVFPRGHGAADPSRSVILYEGQPCPAIGHAVLNRQDKGTSYFDRLWRSGAGNQAESKKRLIITMERSRNEIGNPSILMSDNKSRKKERKNRKKSEAKQQRRNERRLMKRNVEK